MNRPVVVVVSRPGAAADSLRDALERAGAKLAWIGEPEQFDPQRPGGEVVVVNLDPAIEADLAHLAPLWSSESVRVVFNDASVTEGLSGWDLRRWARHLVAKVFASGDHPELPERPPGAEPVPVAIRSDASVALQEEAPVVLRVPGRRYIEDEISEEMGVPPLPYDAPEAVRPISPPSTAEPEPPRSVTETTPASPQRSGEGVALQREEGEEPAILSSASPEASEENVFTDDLDLIVGAGEGPELPPIAIDPDVDFDVATPAEEDELEKLLRQARPEAPPAQTAPQPAAAVPTASNEQRAVRPKTSFGELKLVDESSSVSVSAPQDQKKGVDWSRFRIEGLSLAPLEEERENEGEQEETPPAQGSPGQQIAAAARTVGAAAERLASAEAAGPSAGVGAHPAEQLWLLIGSFGAAEAIAQFLGPLPPSRRAALLIAVSGGDGAAALSSSLAKRTSRSIPLLEAKPTPLAAGAVWIVSDGLRLGSASSRAELRPERGVAGSNWVDALLQDAVGLFATDCGVIVFSGGSREGFDGSLAVARRGGVVWVQDPATAIAPELPELVRSRGLAMFVGSPRTLSEHFQQEVG